MRTVRLLLVALLLAACSDANEGASGTVVEAHVVRVVESGQRDTGSFQRLEVELDSSLYRGERHTLDWNGRRGLTPAGLLHEGDRVLLSVSREGTTRTYAVAEVVRLPQLAPLAAVFAVALVLVAGSTGLAAIAGLIASAGVVLLAIVPTVQRGDDPLPATMLGSALALSLLVVAAGGLRRQSLAALIGSLAGLIAVAGLGAGALALSRASGFTSDDAALLSVAAAGKADLARLVLSGAVVAALGVLSALSIGQAVRTLELATAEPEAMRRDLYLSAVRAGGSSLGSLVNTVAFAILAGALPLVLIMAFAYRPLSVTLNSEELTAILVAALTAGIGLVVCVPVTTAAALFLARR